MVKFDYYAVVPMTSGANYIVTVSQEVPIAASRGLEWGGFSPSGTYTFDIEKGKAYFPMKYSRGSGKLILLWVLSMVMNVALCLAISYGFFRATRLFGKASRKTSSTDLVPESAMENT